MPPPSLGKHVEEAAAVLKKSGWLSTVLALRTPQDIPIKIAQIRHRAARLLNYIRQHGVPVKVKTSPWSQAQLHAALHRGPHKSAHEYAEFLEGEMATMVQKGQWMVLPFSLIQHLSNLRLSPLGVVPQHERRPRTIVDYTFSGVNKDTLQLAPQEAMQFGRTLDRLLQHLSEIDPRHGPVYLIKLDISDGFYRMHLHPSDIPLLGVIMPSTKGADPRIAFPLTLPMGWVQSPPWFCTATETAADLANSWIQHRVPATPHRLEQLANTPTAVTDSHSTPKAAQAPPVPAPPFTAHSRRPPLAYIDVYMDDFVALVQGKPSRRRYVRQLLMQAVDTVFRPKDVSDPSHRQEPISEKKLRKGDGCWETTKTVLGWCLDTIHHTISLTPRRYNRLQEILDSLPRTRKRVRTKDWHQIMGELRSMSLAIPGLRGLFSTLQESFRHDTRKRLPLSPRVHDFLDDIRLLLSDLHHRPTRFREVTRSPPLIIGATDASGTGMGGVFFTRTKRQVQGFVWRKPFPSIVTKKLVSFENPTGTINNSDLELAGTIAHHGVITSLLDVREHTIATLSDNTPALSWQHKGSVTTTGPPAYLLRQQAFHQRTYRYRVHLGHIPGTANAMADDCSRLWQLTDKQFLHYFNTTYPQDRPWRLCHLPNAINSSLTSSLQRHKPDRHTPLGIPPAVTGIGPFGTNSVKLLPWTHTCKTFQTPQKYSWYMHRESGMAAAPAVVNPWGLLRWLPPSGVWHRRSPFWGPQTLV